MSMTLTQTETKCDDGLSHLEGNTDRGYYWEDTDDTSTRSIFYADLEEADLLIDNQLSAVQSKVFEDQSYQQEEEQYSHLTSVTHLKHEHSSKIRFSDIVEAIPCEKHSKVSNPSDCWYTSEEMEAIYNGLRSLSVLASVNEDSLSEVRDCLRGLEGIFPVTRQPSQKYKQKKKHADINSDEDSSPLHFYHHLKRHAAAQARHQKHPNFVRTILDWQSVQRKSGVPNDPTGLRIFSSTCSKHAREEAIARAAQDFLEVQRLWKESL